MPTERWIVAGDIECDTPARPLGVVHGTPARRGDGCAIWQGGLPKNVMKVILHGTRRDAKPIRDPLVAESARDELRHFALTRRKSRQPRVRFLAVAKGRHTKHDQRVAERARGFEVDRD